MFPYIHVFSIIIPAYGVMLILGAIAAVGVGMYQCRYYKYPRADAFSIACIAFACGIAGAVLFRPVTKIPDIIINWEKYSKIPLGEFLSWFIGELVFYGGLIGGFIAVLIYCRRFKTSLLQITDIFAPALPIGHAIGRVGCLLAGCCYGVEVSHSHPFAIMYPVRTDGFEALGAPTGVPLLAIPLIEAAGNIIIAAIIMLFQRKHKVSGRGVAVYGILYSIQRFILEYYRGDLVRGVYGSI
jgi:phosphatidylglycerol:prolipoprotein diacylglycerol transferase